MPPEPDHPGDQRATNGLGTAGIVCSVLGLLTCGVLSPIGLLVSVLALIRPPRGRATAGVALGAVGTLWLLMVGALALGLFGLRAGLDATIPEIGLAKAAQRIEAYRTEHGELPDEATGAALLADHRDHWGRPFRYVVLAGSFLILSAGPDGLFETADDLRFDPDRPQRHRRFDWDD